MKKLLYSLLFVASSATAQINWAQFDLPPSPVGTTAVIHDVKFDQSGNTFIPMDDAGVMEFNGTTETFYNGDNVPLLQGRSITAVDVDQNNLKWFLDGNTLNLITFDGTTWTLVPQSIPGINARGWTLKFDASGILWSVVFTPYNPYNIAKFDGTSWTFYSSLGSSNFYNWFTPLKIDALGRLVWSDGFSIHWFDGFNSDTINATTIMGGGDRITDFEIDSNNMVWLMISDLDFGGQKLAYYSGLNWVVEILPFDAGDVRTRMMLDGQGNFWVPSGNSLWEKTGGSWQSTYNNATFYSADIAVDAQQRWWFYPTDTLNYHPTDNFVTILDQNGVNSISGMVYFDLNANGVQDAGEPPFRNQFINLQPLNYYQLTDDSGKYQFGLIDSAGTYGVTVATWPNWFVSSLPQTYNITQTANLEGTTGIDFGIAPNTFYDDAVVGMSSSKNKRGEYAYYDLSVYNNGTTLLSGEIELDLDPQIQYISAEINPDQVNGNVLTWNYSSLFPGGGKSFYMTCFIPTSVNIGDTLTSTASVTPLYTDVNPGDNSITLHKVVLSSFDPNVKSVYPEGQGAYGTVLPGTTLLYTIEFQNTGNDTAHNITVYDVIGDGFDFTTLQVIGNSHPYHVAVIEDHTLKFDFPNIMLPDSGTNEEASHGFIQYRIKPLSSCPLGTVLTNQASIVFDLNEPVVTNSTTNTLGIPTVVNELSESSSAEVFPNPFSSSTIISFSLAENSHTSIELLDLAGRKIETLLDENLEVGSHELNFNRKSLTEGIYFLEMKTGEGVVTKKVVIE